MKLSHLFSRISSVSYPRWAMTLLTGALVLGLLLGPSTAQAQMVETDANGNVLRILNLTILLDQGAPTVYDVDFINGTGISVYGSTFQFTFTQEEDALAALAQVNDALNADTPVPPAASLVGTTQFFIGAEEDDGLIAAVGGENISGQWGPCETGCIASATVLLTTAPFTYAVFTLAGGAPPDPAPVAGANPYDFNGDGKGDIVWRESLSGTVVVWLMDGGTTLSIGVSGGASLEWKIVGVGDVDGDGKSDLVWHHPSSGSVTLWFMDGVNIGSVGLPGAATLVWVIDEVSDLNGDGKSDIVWRNTSTGDTAVWLMNGATILSTEFPGGVGLNWDIQP